MKILVLPGDGIGPEIVASTLDILRAADERLSLKLSFETMEIGLKTLRRFGTTLPRRNGTHSADGRCHPRTGVSQ
jgi:3-isopropylmalate dehydrogenase